MSNNNNLWSNLTDLKAIIRQKRDELQVLEEAAARLEALRLDDEHEQEEDSFATASEPKQPKPRSPFQIGAPVYIATEPYKGKTGSIASMWSQKRDGEDTFWEISLDIPINDEEKGRIAFVKKKQKNLKIINSSSSHHGHGCRSSSTCPPPAAAPPAASS